MHRHAHTQYRTYKEERHNKLKPKVFVKRAGSCMHLRIAPSALCLSQKKCKAGCFLTVLLSLAPLYVNQISCRPMIGKCSANDHCSVAISCFVAFLLCCVLSGCIDRMIYTHALTKWPPRAVKLVYVNDPSEAKLQQIGQRIHCKCAPEPPLLVLQSVKMDPVKVRSRRNS